MKNILKKFKDYINKGIQILKENSFDKKLVYLFILIMGISFFALIISILVDAEKVLSDISYFYFRSPGADFEFVYEVVQQPSPYTVPGNNSVYPPLSLLIMKGIVAIFPFRSAYPIFHFGVMVFSFALLYKTMKQKKWIKILLLTFIAFSLPFMFAYERGNIVTWFFLCTVLFLYLYRGKGGNTSTDKVKREFAYFFLAMAAAMKIYPIIFIVLLIRNKDFKGMVKTLGYSLILFFAPFLFFEGGLNNIGYFFDNMSNFTKLVLMTYRNNSFASLFNQFIRITGNQYSRFEAFYFSGIAFWLSIAFGFLTGASVLFIKEKHKLLAVLCALSILIPTISSEYNLMFMAPALVAFLNAKQKNKREIVILICYSAIFLAMPLGYFWNDPDRWFDNILINSTLQILAMIIIVVFYAVEGYINMVKMVKQKVFLKTAINQITFKPDAIDMDYSNGIFDQQEYQEVKNENG